MGAAQALSVWPVIATRGRPQWLARQLDALCPQLRGDEHVVVVADGDAEAARLAAARDGVLCVPLAEGVGIYRARRIGIALVPAEAVVCEIDDHDIAEPGLLDALRAAFADARTVAAYCDVYVADPERRVRAERRKPDGRRFAEAGQLGYGMRAYRRWVYDCVGGYPTEYEAAGDYALMVRIEATFASDGIGGRIVHIPECLVTVTQDHTGYSERHREAQQRAVEAIATEALNGRLRAPFEVVSGPVREPQGRLIPPGAVAHPYPGLSKHRPHRPARPRAALVTECLGYGRGGGELSMQAMLRHMSAAGWDVAAVYLYDAGPEPYRADGIATYRLDGCGQDWSEPEARARAMRVLADLQPDVVLVTASAAAWMGRCLAETRIPFVTWVQFWRGLLRMTEAAFEDLRRGDVASEHIDRSGLDGVRRSSAIVANSAFTMEVLEGIGLAVDETVTPPICAESVVAHERTPEAIVCMTAEPLKGTVRFLDLAEAEPQYRFILCAGNADRHGAGDIVERARRIPNVEVITGWVEDVRRIYARAACVYIGTQTAETFSRVAAEALANGVPVLCTDAGNLRRIVDDAHGVVLPVDAPLDAWRDGLRRALALAPEPDTQWVRNDCGRLERVMHRVRRLSEVAVLVPHAPGLVTGARHMAAVLGVRTVPYTEPAGDAALVLGPGGMVPPAGEYERAVWWCSGWAQMETSENEVRRLPGLLAEASRDGIWLLCTDPSLADDLRRRYERVRWLPNVYDTADMVEPGPVHADALRVFVPGPYAPRKSLCMCIAACAAVGAEMVVTDLADGIGYITDLAGALGVPVRVVPCPTVAQVQAAARASHAVLCLGTAETFCLAAADCVAAGAPVVHRAYLPALVGDESPCAVPDATDTGAIAHAIRAAIEDRVGIVAAQQAALRAVARTNAGIARSALQSVLGVGA